LVIAIRSLLSSVGYMIDARAPHDPICRTPWDRGDWIVPPKPFDKLRIPAHRNGMQQAAIESPHVTVSGLAEPGSSFEHRVEDL
jgi:hypothetical protein